MQCRAHAAQLGRHYAEFQAQNTQVVVILGDTLERVKRYTDSLHLPFPVLADPDRAVYHAFGLDMAMVFIQRTASVLVDRRGIVRYLKRTANTFTWLQETQELLEQVQKLKNT